MGNFLSRNFHSQISPGYHDTICFCNNIINILHAFCIFNLCNNFNIFCMVLCQNLANLTNCRCISYKRSCNKINLLLDTKHNIFSVLLGDCRKFYFDIGNIYTFAFPKLSTIYNLAENPVILNIPDFQTNQTVINENPVSLFHIFCQSCISNGATFFIPHSFFCVENKFFSFF